MPGSGAGLWCRDGSESEEAVCSAADPLAVMRRVVEQALVAVPAAQGAAVGLAVSGVVTQMWAPGMLLPAIGTRLNLEGGLSGVAVRTASTTTRGRYRQPTPAARPTGLGVGHDGHEQQ